MKANAGLPDTNPSGLAQSNSFPFVRSVYLFKQNLGFTKTISQDFRLVRRLSYSHELFSYLIMHRNKGTTSELQ